MQPNSPLVAMDRPVTIVLVSPQIPPNTGNIARLCAVTGCKLVLIEPLGFSISDKELKRAGLDYWDKVFLKLYPNWDAYLGDTGDVQRWYFTARTSTSMWDVRYGEGDHLVFGAETTGLSKDVLEGGKGTPVTIPMLEERRSLNLSTAVGIATYEALRQFRR